MMKQILLSIALMLSGFQLIHAEPFLVHKRGINDLFLQDRLTPNSKVARQFPFDHGKVVYNGGSGFFLVEKDLNQCASGLDDCYAYFPWAVNAGGGKCLADSMFMDLCADKPQPRNYMHHTMDYKCNDRYCAMMGFEYMQLMFQRSTDGRRVLLHAYEHTLGWYKIDFFGSHRLLVSSRYFDEFKGEHVAFVDVYDLQTGNLALSVRFPSAVGLIDLKVSGLAVYVILGNELDMCERTSFSNARPLCCLRYDFEREDAIGGFRRVRMLNFDREIVEIF